MCLGIYKFADTHLEIVRVSHELVWPEPADLVEHALVIGRHRVLAPATSQPARMVNDDRACYIVTMGVGIRKQGDSWGEWCDR
jgi:hypothetical protein